MKNSKKLLKVWRNSVRNRLSAGRYELDITYTDTEISTTPEAELIEATSRKIETVKQNILRLNKIKCDVYAMETHKSGNLCRMRFFLKSPEVFAKRSKKRADALRAEQLRRDVYRELLMAVSFNVDTKALAGELLQPAGQIAMSADFMQKINASNK